MEENEVIHMARRKTKRARRRKGYSLSLLNVAHIGVQFSNITGQPLGGVVTQLINSMLSGDDSFMDIAMAVVNGAITNVTTNPVGVAMKGAFIALAYGWLRSALPSKTLIKVGKYSIRT